MEEKMEENSKKMENDNQLLREELRESSKKVEEKMEENNKKMEEKMGEKLEELKEDNQLLREELRAVSYTHLDVYKRQI